MLQGPTVITAVLSTLVRATVDAQTPVVLRTRRVEQARELAQWLEQAHGSRRVVIPSATASGAIEVRLPARMTWPAPVRRGDSPSPPLASTGPAAHL
jgi:hypothetical protein